MPRGRASVSFNAEDFGNFLQHPLVHSRSSVAVVGRPFRFEKHVVFQPGLQPPLPPSHAHRLLPLRNAVACLRGRYNGSTFEVSMSTKESATSNNIVCDAKHVSGVCQDVDGEEALVSNSLSQFFGNLSLDLNGTRMQYAAMQFFLGEGDAGDRKSVV